MGTFNTKKILSGDSSSIPAIAAAIEKSFINDGYEVKTVTSPTGACDISITKGGFFAVVLGLKSALKIVLKPLSNNISFEAGIGIFGQEVIPTVIMLFFAWPVLITQIWGLVKQAKLDDKALLIAETTLSSSSRCNQSGNFCKACGTPYNEGDRFCGNCGSPLQ